MTLRELSNLYYLNREIEADYKRLEDLRARAAVPPQSKLSDMPRAPHRNDSKTEQMAVLIADIEKSIVAKQKRCIDEYARLNQYIDTIPDPLTRLIFQHRFVDGLPWSQVACSIGGIHTKDSVKKICYRYLAAERKEAE